MTTKEFNTLHGKVALISGASRGIGEATVRVLADKGVKVVLAARSTADLESIVSDIKSKGGEVASIAVNVTDPKQVKAAIAFAETTFGGLDFVFSNAGTYGPTNPHLDVIEDEEIQQVIEVNLLGSLYFLKYAVPALKRRGGGVIAFNSSMIAAVSGSFVSKMGGSTVYAASKAGVDHLVRSTFYYQDDGIRIYGVLPAVFKTAMATELVKAPHHQAAGFTDLDSFGEKVNFSKTSGDPANIGKLVASLFDGSTKYPPNTNIVIDNNITWLAHEFYKSIELVQPPNPENPRDIFGTLVNQSK